MRPLPELLSALKTGSADSRIAAARELGDRLGPNGTLSSRDDRERALVTLIDELQGLDRRKAGDGRVLRHLVRTAGLAGDARAIPRVVDLLVADPHGADDDEELVDEVCHALAALDARAALPLLREALVDEDFELHERAIANAIADLGGSAEEETLLDALGAERPDVQKAALESLRKVGTSAATGALEKLAESDDPEIAIDARLTIAIIDEARRAEAAEVVADATGLAAQSEALRIFGEPAAQAIIKTLVPALFDPAWSARRFEVAELLASHGSDEAKMWLAGAANDVQATSWQRVRAAVVAVSVDFDDALFDQIVEGMTKGHDPRLETRDFVVETAELAMETLPRALAHHPHALGDWLRVVADLARDGDDGGHDQVARKARASLQSIVGPRWESELDTFLERLIDAK